MTTGEKIKAYRELRGWNQKTLADYSNIPVDNIRKYESGARNPKLAQLQKIANGLQISIHALIDINIETIDDIMHCLLVIASKKELVFEGEKDDSGRYIAESLKFSFKSPSLQQFMKELADIEQLRQDAENIQNEQVKTFALQKVNELQQKMELNLNMMNRKP